MSDSVLSMTGAEFQTIVEHCRRELPSEACGILGGRDGRVESVHPVKSTCPIPARYAMDPEGQFRALDELSRAGRELVGIYHSHPGGSAAPSRVDVEEACRPGTTLPNYPGAIQVIVSLQGRAAPVVKGYVLAAGKFIEVAIAICQESGGWKAGGTPKRRNRCREEE